ncbi:MAG TPA: 5-oxoprolinase subunit PxpB [Chthoniobacterales bacterium]|nr:5-oxoprolinase subunit PxpB [Chthoniobacterales bacterium]
MRIEPLGDSALLVRVVENYGLESDRSVDAVLGTFGRLEAAAIPGVIELAPAYTTIGVFFDPGLTRFDVVKAEIERVLQNTEPAEPRAVTRSTIEVPVCYEDEFAPDLREVAWHAGLSAQEVVRRHSAVIYRVNCVGFTPGFPYLSGLPTELATPRRASPRKEIPAGAVAIGGTQTGIYPRKSPGGWNIIGRTSLSLFEVKREPPSLFQAGDRVRFRRISREEFERSSA